MNLAAASAISLRQLRYCYQQQVIFDNFAADFRKHHFSCILGPSGVGKSTLLKLILGLIIPDSTSQIIKPADISYMGQQDLLLPWCTVLENIVLGARLRSQPQPIKQATQLLERVGLSHIATQLPEQLSGGMRQRVALLRTIIESRDVILMDEPFSAVDAITRLQLQQLAAELLMHKTVVLVTHDPLEALRLGHDIYILSGLPATLDLIIQRERCLPALAEVDLMKDYDLLMRRLSQAVGLRSTSISRYTSHT
ncbi:MAG: ATP-binding cassette domain-containing protein [Gammaproteobacteria bacterium]